MSPIGRAFIILNFLLAAVFLSFGAFYLQSAEQYKAKYTSEKADHATTKKSLSSELTSVKEALDTTGDDRDRIQSNLQDVETRLSDRENENSELKKKLDTLNASFTSQAASLSTVATTIDKLSSRNEEITKGWLKAQNVRDVAVSERNDMENQLTSVRGRFANAGSRIDDLLAELNEKTETLRMKDILWEAALVKVPSLDKILLGILPPVSGTVVAVNEEFKTVTISLGTNQAEVKVGWTFSVHDGKSYKGEVHVFDVDDNVAIARYRGLKNAIVKGDKVNTRL